MQIQLITFKTVDAAFKPTPEKKTLSQKLYQDADSPKINLFSYL